MKKICLSVIAILYSVFLVAQKTETFDIATYKIPAGWKKSVKEGLVSYSTSNDSKEILCIINIYASNAATETANEAFDKYWQDLVVAPFDVKDQPQKDTSSDDGREIVTGSAAFKRNEIKGITMLTTIVGFGRVNNVLIITNDESYQKNIEDFFASFTLKKAVENIASGNTGSSSLAPANTFHPKNELEGVWMAMHLKRVYVDKVPTGVIKWITFFDNGRTDKLIPDEGMNNFDKNAPSIGYYKIVHHKASLQWFPDTPPFDITFKTADQITFEEPFSNDIYYRCRPVDGLRLQGSWTSFNNTSDPELNDASKLRPLFTFTKDGKFTDYGVFAEDYSNPVPPGSGTYSINNFTLTLNYSNGRVKQTSFTGALSNDPAKNDKSLYIHRLSFRKRQ